MELASVYFDYRKAGKRLADVQTVRFHHHKRVRRLRMFGECVLSTANRVGGLQWFIGSF